jgi:hypothetical protein
MGTCRSQSGERHHVPTSLGKNSDLTLVYASSYRWRVLAVPSAFASTSSPRHHLRASVWCVTLSFLFLPHPALRPTVGSRERASFFFVVVLLQFPRCVPVRTACCVAPQSLDRSFLIDGSLGPTRIPHRSRPLIYCLRSALREVRHPHLFRFLHLLLLRWVRPHC